MRSHKSLSIQTLLQGRERLANQMATLTSMNRCVIIIGLNPINLVSINEKVAR
jgi:hypothetical protein